MPSNFYILYTKYYIYIQRLFNKNSPLADEFSTDAFGEMLAIICK